MTSGKTLIAGIMGWPVSHSRSPALHTQWLQHYGIDGVYLPLPVRPEHCEEAIRALPKLGFRGVNLTIPHKEIAYRMVDQLDPIAAQAGAVNTIAVQADGALHGLNTDVFGFSENLRQHRCEVANKTILVYGAGGAARAVLVALQQMGARKIILCNRSQEHAEQLAAAMKAEAVPWQRRHDVLAAVDGVINTTSQGMQGQTALDVTLQALPQAAWVADIVYVPLHTPLLTAAAQRGHKTVDGLGMLLHQARVAFEAWFGVLPEVTPELYALLAKGL